MAKSLLIQESNIVPPLEPGFRPVSLGDRAYREAVQKEGGVEICIAYEREGGLTARGDTRILPARHPNAGETLDFLLDRITAGLVHNGATVVHFSGPRNLGMALKRHFQKDGSREWYADLMTKSYDKPFEFILAESDHRVPGVLESASSLGGGLVGNRIGFDLGKSDFKVSAFRGKECVFSHEYNWDPSTNSNPMYHFAALLYGLTEAAKRLDYQVDAIGGSSAGVWVDSRLKVGSIARGVMKREGNLVNFNRWLVDETANYFGFKPIILNDGNVTAMAGQMFIPNSGGVVGIAMGSDEAGGYSDPQRKMSTKLYEWAFWRIDRGIGAPLEEWCEVKGVGGMYFGQRAYGRLYRAAEITHDEVGGEGAEVKDKLTRLQAMIDRGDERAVRIAQTIGVELGYSVVPYIEESGETSHVVVVGRCMRGKAGDIILANADRVLRAEFSSQYNFQLFNPEADSFVAVVGSETAKRFKTLGQAMAAATIPPVPAGYKA